MDASADTAGMLAAGLTPLEGGWSGETFVSGESEQRVVVRIYANPGERGETAQHLDAAVMRLVRGLVPVPQVVECRRPMEGVPGLLITTFEPGERGDQLLSRLDDQALATVGSALGNLAATLGGVAQLEAGFFADESLRVERFPAGEDLAEWAALHEQGLVAHGWSSAELSSLRALADDAQDLLDTVSRRCLVHGDLNPKNILIDPETLTVTAVLDWESAHSGHPFTDLGNLLRFERQPALVAAVLDAYGSRLGEGRGPAESVELAEAADLVALVDLAARASANPVAARAGELLRARVAGIEGV